MYIKPFKKFYNKIYLLPLSITLFILPFCVDAIQTVIWFGLFHFVSVFLFMHIFPDVLLFFQSKPIYVEDIEHIRKPFSKSYICSYTYILNISSSILWGLCVDYMVLKHIFNKPFVEALGIIGGNIALFSKVQQILGNVLLNMYYYYYEFNLNKTPIINHNKKDQPSIFDFLD